MIIWIFNKYRQELGYRQVHEKRSISWEKVKFQCYRAENILKSQGNEQVSSHLRGLIILKVGGHLYIRYKKSQGVAHTRMLLDQNKKKVLKITNRLGIREYCFALPFSQQSLWTRDDSGNLWCRERSIDMHHSCLQCGHPLCQCLTLPSSDQEKL